MFKTDWNANDYLNFEDLNRIEELTEDLYDYIVDNIDPNLPIPQYTFADEEKEIIGREGFKTDRDKNWIDSYRDFFAIENNITYLYERIKELYPELEISWITPRMGGQPYSLTPRDVVQIDKDLTNSFLELSFPDDLWEEFDSSPLDEQEKIIRTFRQPIENDIYSVKTSDSFKIILENTINKNEITLYEYDYNNSEVITNLKYIYTTMGIVKNIYEEHPAYEYIKALPNDYVINAVDFQGAYYPNSPISYVDLNRIETNLKNLTEAVHNIEEE